MICESPLMRSRQPSNRFLSRRASCDPIRPGICWRGIFIERALGGERDPTRLKEGALSYLSIEGLRQRF
jgi:hypothetical protein